MITFYPPTYATEATVSQLAMAISNEIDETAYDLNAAPFSETTTITKDYILDNVELNFSTAEAKTITVTSSDGTILWGGSVDTSASNLGYNTTKQHFFLSFGRGFNANENITITVTQFSSAGTMDCILKIRSGTDTLLGDPTVKLSDIFSVLLELDALVKSVPTTGTFHHLGHEGKVFIHSDKHSVASGANLDYLLKVPASPSGRQVHLRFDITSSELPADIELYRDTIVSADGTPEVLNSTNDVVVKTTGVELFEGPTITDLGNAWPVSLLTGAKNSGGSGGQLVPEYIGGPGVNYLIRYNNGSNSTADVVSAVFFYDSEAS